MVIQKNIELGMGIGIGKRLGEDLTLITRINTNWEKNGERI